MDVRLDEVVLHALEKEPERRYQHASEITSDLKTILSPAAAGGTCTKNLFPPPGTWYAALQTIRKRQSVTDAQN